MLSRTQVPRWTPPFKDALRLAWRPAAAYLAFTGLGSIVLLLTSAWYSHRGDRDFLVMLLGLTAGIVGTILGQLVAILRFRALPVFVVTGISIAIVVWIISQGSGPGGELVSVPIAFFFMAFPCGLLALMHRWELFASFWPAVGWIGGVFVILNHEERVVVWEEQKAAAWLPVPLIYLGCFLVLWLVYFAAKQAARVEMWQALSGAAGRRISKKEHALAGRVAAVPRRNVLPILVVAAILFGGTALLAPYLWRTGKGDREGTQQTKPKPDPDPPRHGPKMNTDGLVEQLQKIANAAKDSLPRLWPLLLLLALYRPTKRALLLTHLKAPIVPTPPSERIDNLWEYVRIAAEDAGVVPTSADSVEQLLDRIVATGHASPALARAAEIYVRTRYGFIVGRGDAIAMRSHASEAATFLRKDLDTWQKVKNLWRPLS